MRSPLCAWSTGVLAVVAVMLAGCGETSTAPPAAELPSERSQARALPAPEGEDVAQEPAGSSVGIEDTAVKPAVATAEVRADVPESTAPAPLPTGPRQPIPLEEATDSGTKMPPVFLTEHHAKTCLLHVGDALPQFELPDMSGEKQRLAELMGERLTVVVFWDAKQPTALEQLADMQRLVVDRFEKDGVRVIGINKGDDPQLAEEMVEQRGATFANLSDRDGAAFAQVATEKIPRTYLVDADGKIVWFDMEYSRTTRQDLVAAIRYLLSR